MISSKGFPGARGYFHIGLAAFLLLFSGCATTAPTPLVIKYDRTPPEPQAAATAGGNTSKLIDLLRERNLITVEDAARFEKQTAPRAQGVTNAAGVPETADDKNIEEIKAEVIKDVMAKLPEEIRKAEQALKTKDKKNIEEIKAEVIKEVMAELPEELMEAESALKTKEDESVKRLKAEIAGEVGRDLKQQVRNDVQEELPDDIKNANSGAADWTRRISLGGDIRLRYEDDRFPSGNYQGFLQPMSPNALNNAINTWADKDSFKYRVRLGAEAQVDDQLNAAVRLTTGNTSTPVSLNDTMGSSTNGYFNRFNAVIDLAYLQWRPARFLAITGGRIPNPWLSTDLVWGRDLTFDGFAVSAKQPVSKWVTPFLTVGAFPLEQSNPVSFDDFSTHSKWLYAGQLGVERPNPKGVAYSAGAAFYDFSNITGQQDNYQYPASTDWSAPLFMQWGNTLMDIHTQPQSTYSSLPSEPYIIFAPASEFRELDFTGNLDLGFWDPYHIVLSGDFVKNLGFNQAEVAQRAFIWNGSGSIGYQVGVAVGYPTIPQRAGQWKAYLSYKYLEGDAVVDAFTDPDFHLGGTNARGWILGTDYTLRRNYWLTLRWLTSDAVNGPRFSVDVLQLDFNALF